MSKSLDIKAEHLEIVKNILKNNLAKNSKVLVFGSRALKTAKRFSDLDLALDLNRKINIKEFADLKESFDNSDLPYTVDIIDINAIDKDFKQHILSNSIDLKI